MIVGKLLIEVGVILLYICGNLIVKLIQIKFLDKLTGSDHLVVRWKQDALKAGQFGSWITIILLMSLSLITWISRKLKRRS